MLGKKTGGRVKGSGNLHGSKAAKWCRYELESKAYRALLHARLMKGTLAPGIEAMLWHYAYGKPIETQQMVGPGGGPIQTQTVIVDELWPVKET